MRVAVYYNNRDVRLEERPMPEIGPGELLVRVHASGICGSDVMEWYRLSKAPLVLGHEIAGEVVQAGEGVTGFRKGDRITAAHHVPCNTCHYCLSGHHTFCETVRKTSFDPGGFAEYLRLPAINVDRGTFLLPDEVSYEEATFVEPLACILRGQRSANLKPGQSMLVIGSGLAGLLHIQLARALGAGRIMATDIVPYRLEAALKLGADTVFPADDISPERLRRLNDRRLADLVIVCTAAASAFTQAAELVERGGTILYFALPQPGFEISFPLHEFFFNNLTLTTSYAGSPADYATALELIRARRIDIEAMVTHRLGLAEAGLGFRLIADAGDSIKVIVEPQR